VRPIDFLAGTPGPLGDLIRERGKSRGKHCVQCKQDFVFGTKGAPGVNCYTQAGWRETQISMMCEVCFDQAFEETE
jgi:hypothetical protein